MRIGQHYYTWCHRDTGCEGITGFQTRAKSASITPEIERIMKRYCSRYVLPRSLENLTAKADELTATELRRCPEILHYYPINRELWGLTRSRLSANQRGRGGNFFAHTLVFPRDLLAQVGSNPFELARMGVLQFSAEDTIGKNLSDLPEFPRITSKEEYRQRCIVRYREAKPDLLRPMLSALLDPRQAEKKRPIILCDPKFEEIANIIEAMLLLVPPGFRRLVAFSTYEPDPYRLFEGDEARNVSVNRVIGTIPPSEGGKFQFRQDEYQTGFYVFDLGSGRQSVTPEPSEYVRFVCDAVNRSDWLAVERVQKIVTAVGSAKEPALWDVILPASFLLSEEESLENREKWRRAIDALAKESKTPARARQALKILWRKSQSLLPRLDTETASKVVSMCRELVKTAGPEASGFLEREHTNLIAAFCGLILARRCSLARDLLSLVGQTGNEVRNKVIVEGLTCAQAKGWPRDCLPARGDPRDLSAFVEVLDEGLRGLASDNTKASLFGELLEEGFSGVQSTGGFKAIWSKTSPWLFAEGLRRVPLEKLPNLFNVLGALLVKENEHEGRRALGLWELKNTTLSEKGRLTTLLEEISAACKQCANPRNAVQATLSEAKTILHDKQDALLYFFIVLFREVEAEAEDGVLKHYREYVNSKSKESCRWEARRQIASVPNGERLLAAECTSMLFPWSPKSGRSCIQAWITEVVRSNDDFASLVSQKISKASSNRQYRPVATEVLTTCLNEFSSSKFVHKKALTILGEALISFTPLEGFRRTPVANLLSKIDTSGWKQETRAFLQMAQCYSQARRLSNYDCPDLSSLIDDYPDLPRTLSCLSDERWKTAAQWIVSGLRGFEIEKLTSVTSLMMLVILPTVQRRGGPQTSSGEPQEKLDRSSAAANMIIDQLRSKLLQGRFRRDPSTHVSVLSSFVMLTPSILRQTSMLHDDPRLGSVALIVGSILAEDHAVTRRLLWRRLETHAGLDERHWQTWLRAFWRQVRCEMRLQRRQKSLLHRLGRLMKKVLARRIISTGECNGKKPKSPDSGHGESGSDRDLTDSSRFGKRRTEKRHGTMSP